MKDRPLHVRVAEALGCTTVTESHPKGIDYWACECPGALHGDNMADEGDGMIKWLPRYDIDWHATGPLIQRIQILIQPPMFADEGDNMWAATGPWRPAESRRLVKGETPLIAVCNLILALNPGHLEPPDDERDVDDDKEPTDSEPVRR